VWGLWLLKFAFLYIFVAGKLEKWASRCVTLTAGLCSLFLFSGLLPGLVTLAWVRVGWSLSWFPGLLTDCLLGCPGLRLALPLRDFGLFFVTLDAPFCGLPCPCVPPIPPMGGLVGRLLPPRLLPARRCACVSCWVTQEMGLHPHLLLQLAAQASFFCTSLSLWPAARVVEVLFVGSRS